MDLNQSDLDKFNQSLQRIELNLGTISWFMTPCAPLEKKLMKLIQYGNPKWICSSDQRRLTVALGKYTITLALNMETGATTEVVIRKQCALPAGDQQIPAVQLPLAIWFMAYNRALKDNSEDTLDEVFDKFTPRGLK